MLRLRLYLNGLFCQRLQLLFDPFDRLIGFGVFDLQLFFPDLLFIKLFKFFFCLLNFAPVTACGFLRLFHDAGYVILH